MLHGFSILFWFRHAALWLATWAMGTSISAAPCENVYTFRRSDALYGIAWNHKLSLTILAGRNALDRDHPNDPGRCLISAAKSSPQRPPGPTLPSSVQRAIETADVKPGRWKYIVLHHSGVDTGTLHGMDRYHREVRHMENGLAYHFVIGNGHGMGDGEIGIGSRWTQQLDGGHLISERQSKVSLGICLVGSFDKHKPTPKQLQRLTALVRALMTRCSLSPQAVKTHQQINVVYTRCPGRHFPTKSFLKSLRASNQ